MLTSPLPPEIVSLIHHVELNKADWWKRGMQSLILGILWIVGKSMTIRQLIEALSKEYAIGLDQAKAQDHLRELCTLGSVVCLPDGTFKVAEQSLREFEADLKECDDLRGRVKAVFEQALAHHCPSLNPEDTWRTFIDRVLLPMIRAMGARTYELISRSTVEFERVTPFLDFLDEFPAETRGELRSAIINFLDPRNADVRSFTLGYLNAYFFLEASNLSDDTLRGISQLCVQKPSFKILVDTNFLLSILGLHENPSNEAALALLALIHRLSPYASIQLYAFPLTLDETRNVLSAYRESLKNVRFTPALAEVASQTEISGIARKYVQEAAKTARPIRAEDYFDPYIKDLIRILRSKGVEFFDADIEGYRARQDVLDDVVQRLEFEQQRYGDRAKDYKGLLHDMVLWHFVHDKRPMRVDSPLQCEYWVVTVDFRFLGFDAFKRRRIPGQMPVCMHPSALIQMLQFWSPRTSEFEEAVLGSLRLPFLFRRFDVEAERITIRILQALSRFENVDDLSKETIADVLVNEALRQRLSGERDIERQVELVKEALVEKYKITEDALRVAQRGEEDLRAKVSEKERTISELETRLSEQHSRAQELEDRLKKQVMEMRRANATRKERRAFARNWLLLPPFFIGLFGCALSWLLMRLLRLAFWTTAGWIWSVALFFWLWLADVRGQRNEAIPGWCVFDTIHAWKGLLFAALGAIALGILGNAAWEWLRGWLR
jgi:hypothetical protein